MRPSWRWGIAGVVALVLGAACAEPYARLAAPFYLAVDRLIAARHPWAIEQVAVARDPAAPGVVLRLIGEVRRQRGDAAPAAIVVSRVQVGEVIETPLVFWTLLLVWPVAGGRQRWARLAAGAAVFLGLEVATTAAQLLHSMAEASALLARGPASVPDEDPLTAWARWSRFLEAGGNFAVAAAAALLTVAASNVLAPAPRPAID